VLHVEQLGQRLRRTGAARVRRHITHALAVHEDLPVVMQRFEEFFAGADGHGMIALSLSARAGYPACTCAQPAGISWDFEVFLTRRIWVIGEPSYRFLLRIDPRPLSGAGYTLQVPAIDLAEVGAGGGSILWIDAGGALQVGPTSAGAVPGPVCYDQGGAEPTVTDGNVVLGYINPAHLVGGALSLNAAKARAVIADRIARPLGIAVEEAAYGAHLIAASNMIRALKAVSSERGPRPARIRARRLRR
jgi:hypothetical protein